MPVNYHVKAAIINESKSGIERYAARIVQVSNHTEEVFVKTYPLTSHIKNLAHISSLREDLENSREPFLGISFLSYGFISFIHFTSSFRLFCLEKGDSVTFVFDNKEELVFEFSSPRTPDGYISKNIHPIKDHELTLISRQNLDHWVISNERGHRLVGGFAGLEHNKQYKSPKTGQKILRLMAENILIAKEQLT